MFSSRLDVLFDDFKFKVKKELEDVIGTGEDKSNEQNVKNNLAQTLAYMKEAKRKRDPIKQEQKPWLDRSPSYKLKERELSPEWYTNRNLKKQEQAIWLDKIHSDLLAKRDVSPEWNTLMKKKDVLPEWQWPTYKSSTELKYNYPRKLMKDDKIPSKKNLEEKYLNKMKKLDERRNKNQPSKKLYTETAEPNMKPRKTMNLQDFQDEGQFFDNQMKPRKKKNLQDTQAEDLFFDNQMKPRKQKNLRDFQAEGTGDFYNDNPFIKQTLKPILETPFTSNTSIQNSYY